MPRFWIFMYRVSPFTYLVSAMLSVGLANTQVVCSDRELLKITPPSGQTCMEYLGPYMEFAGGYLTDENATTDCSLCSVKDTNFILEGLSARYNERWRNFGLLLVYIAFNIVAAVFIYWLVRVPKNSGKEEAPTEEALALQKTRTNASGAGLEKKETMMSRASRTLSFGAKNPAQTTAKAPHTEKAQ